MDSITEQVVKISRQKIKRISSNPEATAKAVDLVYVQDTQPGIARIKKGKAFDYVLNRTRIKSDEELKRIKSLVIPPAWENVWICVLENGHLQATGLDVKKRKQYRYHPLWNTLRNHTKFYRMHEFGKILPTIRLQLEKDLSLPGLPQEKVLALVVSLMERTHIRIGNNAYEKLYGSFGLTTLKDKHVNVNGSSVKFTFKGKKGVDHDITIRNKKLSKLVQQCRDIPGKELFQYYDQEGQRHSIDSGMLNNYIKTISGADFTAKDFRTWAGTIQAFLAFKELGFVETVTETKKKVVEALDMVSKELGNTRTVCKKYYVHPSIIEMYENKTLAKYIEQLDEIQVDDNKADLTKEEKLVMKILESKK
ncbi:MAG: DNA topoisomerase IB [Ferruginibacter sp.]